MVSRAWIIGGTSGIGKACADLLRKDMVTTSTGKDEFDVRQSEHFWRHQITDLQYPTHVVYSAGINYLNWLGEMGSNDSHQDVIDVNLMGFIRLMNAMVWAGKLTHSADPPGMNKFHRGNYPFGVKPSIVVISSDAAERPLRTSIGYCASKAGLNMAVKVAARELGPHGWRINAVSPGMTSPTGMSDYVDERVPEVRGWTPAEADRYERSQEVVPGRIDPTEVAQVVYDVLMGPPHLNGSIVTINGGR
ncbi:FabG-like 3-oxoacyl-(acyl-carrier-protein) reductase [Mycobacterium phage Hawkeye]|uniref:FabG-like protein n=1 Tax=Mycobacterium phage Hawkeye TaxID=1458711 RepID=X2KYX1_9CAUD|nr:FabG-like 3-oxoacyl-(acyl-carrier-protein) reductase [Mycobacterium phage Hawkeye]AHN84084.1 FabG-like protein [Mycobacterium phage Hawkeye]